MIRMRTIGRPAAALLFLCVTARSTATAQAQAEDALANLRRQIEAAHASRDAEAFGALHTESTVFEWQGRSTPLIGRSNMIESRKKVWAPGYLGLQIQRPAGSSAPSVALVNLVIGV